MREFSVHPREIVASFWRNRGLIFVSIKREVLGRYRGSILGIFWSFFNPILMLSVYTFVFSAIFKARWSPESESTLEFAIILFIGLMVFNLFSECLNRAPTLILNNANYVKKVVFPLEILPWISMGTALFHFCVSMSVWLVAYVFLFGVPHVTGLYLPLVLFPFILLIMGFSWFLASLGLFLRDTSQFIGIVIATMMFLSPIFFPTSAIPREYQVFLYLNPVTPVVEIARDVLYWGRAPNPVLLGTYMIIAIGVAWSGFSWFQKTRKGFSDVL